MSSLYSLTNIDIKDPKHYCMFYENSNHPFSKKYNCKVKMNNVEYLTVEHYYQSQKFISTHSKIYQQILNAETSDKAYSLAIQNEKNVRKDWSKIKMEIYYKGQKKKFQNNELKQILLATKQKPIICIAHDTFLGLEIGKDDKQILKGENNGGIILSTIRDELLLNDSDDEEKDEKKNEHDNALISGNVSKKFNQTYSAIFAPFLVNVVVRLLNNSNEITLNLDHYIANWGGGIRMLRTCCIENQVNPLDKNCNWDTLIDLSCISTPVMHNVWIRLLKYNKINITDDPIRNLEDLLNLWMKNGQYHRMYGSYPRAAEQELYIQETIPREISEILNYAIINDVFKQAFIAMHKCKKQDATATQQVSSFVSFLWNLIDKSIAEFIPMR